MSISWFSIWLALLLLITVTLKSGAEDLQLWCVADEQTPDSELQLALDWACGKGGADCSKLQVNQPCYLPNTLRDHASYAFNSYYQKLKHKGASCNFRGAAMTTEVDPSKGGCHYEFLP